MGNVIMWLDYLKMLMHLTLQPAFGSRKEYTYFQQLSSNVMDVFKSEGHCLLWASTILHVQENSGLELEFVAIKPNPLHTNKYQQVGDILSWINYFR